MHALIDADWCVQSRCDTLGKKKTTASGAFITAGQCLFAFGIRDLGLV